MRDCCLALRACQRVNHREEELSCSQNIARQGGPLRQSTSLQVVCGPTTTAALSDVGTVYVWGNNAHAMLGLGISDESVPVPAQLRLPTPAVDIAMGAMHGLAIVQEGSNALAAA